MIVINCHMRKKNIHPLCDYFHHTGEKAKANRFITCLQDSKELGSTRILKFHPWFYFY